MSELVNVEAEMAVIGSVLVNPDAIATLADWLPFEAFGDARCRSSYRAMLRLWDRRVPPDLVCVPAELMAMGGKDEGTAVGFLLSCREAVESWFYVEHYAEQVLTFARLRAIADGGAQLVKAAHGDAAALDLDEQLAGIRRGAETFTRSKNTAQALVDQVADFREEAMRIWSGDYVPTVLPTRLRLLDTMLNGGIRPDDMVVLAARPSIGKTSMMLDLARHHRSLVCSLEMPKRALINRMIATEAGVGYEVGVSPIGDLAKRERWLRASETVEQWPLMIRDDLRTTATIEAEVSRLQRDGGVDCVFIDHVGWLGDSFKSNVSQYDKVSALSRRCAEAMKRTGVPFVLLSQLNREVEHRPGCVPYMSDLRESGKLEEDATIVMLMYRRAYYSSRNMGGLKPDIESDYIRGHANWDRLTLSITKNRNGQTGSVDVGWEPQSMRVHDVDVREAA